MRHISPLRFFRWLKWSTDTLGRWQALLAVGVVSFITTAVVAVVEAMLDLGSPWGYFIFVSVFLMLYSAGLWAVEKVRATPFPLLEIQIEGTRHQTQVQTHPSLGYPLHREHRVVVLRNVRVTNREKVRRASLTFRLFAKLLPGALGSNTELPLEYLAPAPNNQLALPMPVNVESGQSVGGEVWFLQDENPHLYATTPGENYRCEVEDHLSGTTATVPLYGTYVTKGRQS